MLSRADSDATVSMTETRKNGAHMEKKKKKVPLFAQRIEIC